MKVGIVTFYHVSNYGAVLQAFAMQTYLEQKGHAPFFINTPYTRRGKYTFASLLFSRSIAVLRNKLRHNRTLKTWPTLKMLRDTAVCYPEDTLAENHPVADAYIVGSDQMWNPEWCMEHAGLLFLNFGSAGAKRIAYAVSLACTSWPEQTREAASKLMTKFDAISVREKSAVEIVSGMSGKKVSWLADPSLLIAKEQFPSLPDGGEKPGLPYIFEYFLGEPGVAHSPYTIAVQQEMAAPVILSDNDLTPNPLLRPFNIRRKIPIRLWLARIKNAECIVTNSFHATIFAILHHRPFIAVLKPADDPHAGMNERLISLLTRLGLTQCMVSRCHEADIRAALAAGSCIDWQRVDDAIRGWRLETEAFFAEALKGTP